MRLKCLNYLGRRLLSSVTSDELTCARKVAGVGGVFIGDDRVTVRGASLSGSAKVVCERSVRPQVEGIGRFYREVRHF